MKLTKSEIQFIDDHLKTQGIGYWDIRLEMVDHIACKIEERQGSYDFNHVFDETIDELGWTGNLKDFECRRLKSINDIIRKKYFSYFINLFTKAYSLLYVLLFILAYYLVFKYFSSKTFGIISLILFGLPIIYFTIHYAYMSLKFKKSGYLLYGYFYIVFSMLLFNLLYQLPRPDGIIEVSHMTRQYIIFFTTICNVLLMYSGIKIYLETSKTYKAMHRRLHLD